MRTYNSVTLLGRIGRDAEVKTTKSGTVATISVATENRFKRGDEWVSETDWHSVVVWSCEKYADRLVKGAPVFIAGRLRTRSYDDKDGNKRYVTEVVATQVSILDVGNRDSGAARNKNGSGWGAAPSSDDDDAPF